MQIRGPLLGLRGAFGSRTVVGLDPAGPVILRIDDFGVGTMALSRLRALPVRGLILGRAFVASLPDDRAAATIATAIVQMARAANAPFEMQRLHGMGEGVYREVLKDGAIACRVYAPVGEHRDLLAYLVRRLLENGANSSFVHQLADEAVSAEELLASPLRANETPSLPLPVDLYGAARRNSLGVDLAVPVVRQFRDSFPQPIDWSGFTASALRSGKVAQIGPIIGVVIFWFITDRFEDSDTWRFIILGTVAVVMAAVARSGVDPMLTRATPVVPLRTAATPTMAQSRARRLNFWYDQPAPGTLGTTTSVSSSSGARAVSRKVFLNSSKLPNDFSISVISRPAGWPPPPGFMHCQKKLWFQTWAALLKTAALSAAPALSRITFSKACPAHGVPATSLFRLSTYVW